MGAAKNIAFYILRDIKRIVIQIGLEFYYSARKRLQNNVQTIWNGKCKKILFLTHDLGGGTQQFENSFLEHRNNVVILRRLGYMFMHDKFFQIEWDKNKKIVETNEIKQLWNFKFDEIIINSLVGFRCIEKIIDDIIKYKKEHPECIIRYFVHDYNCICPSHNLFLDGKYCGLNCLNCNLKLNYGNRKPDILTWQHIWERLLISVDEIRCFSNCSKELIIAAYENISSYKISVVPHDISYIKNNPILEMEKNPMCIGFIGSITNASKGDRIVKKIIRRYGDQINIRLIGSNKMHYMFDKGKKVKNLGSYNRDDLRDILIEEKVNIVIFPSLWPETFSYLVSELMAFNILIICFDIGAQAEKIKKYHKGTVCKNLVEMFSVIDYLYSESLKGYENVL